MDILAGIVGQALRMIGYLVGFGHAGVIPGLLTRRFEFNTLIIKKRI